MTFHLVDTVGQVLAVALEEAPYRPSLIGGGLVEAHN